MMKKIRMILDGAMGTELQKLGMPPGVSADVWAMDHKEELEQILSAYAAAGANAVLTSTFGSNRMKLKRFGMQKDVARINAFHVQCAKRAAPHCMVGGDMGPTGEFVYPLGETTFDEMVEVYAEQADALAKAGADFIIIETMMDLIEARAAVLGAKSVCDLPIIASMTFASNGKTLTGSPPECAAIALRAAGASVVGTNCGAGPAQMEEIVQKMAFYAGIPIIAQPNAGMPKLIDNQTVYAMSPEAFAQGVAKLHELGAHYVGGCCGTTPAHIKAVAQAIHPVRFEERKEGYLCNERRFASREVAVVVRYEIGEDFDEERLEDFAQDTAGVLCLTGDVSAQAMTRAIQVTAPHALLGFALRNDDGLRAALKAYCGRALVYDSGTQGDCIDEFGALRGEGPDV